MQGKTVIVTGANSGIGKVTATELARRGSHVVMACRNVEKGEAALAEARAAIAGTEGAGTLALEQVDVSSLADVRAFAGRMLAAHPKLDVLINNAGVYLPDRKLTAEGHERMLATNHLGPFLLTALLRPALAAAGSSRMIAVASEGHRAGGIDLGDLGAERGFGGLSQYCNTKLMNVLFASELHRRAHGEGIAASSYHPGAVATGFAQDESSFFGFLVKLGAIFLRSPARGARTGIWLASSPDAASPEGRYFIDEKPKTPAKPGRDDALAAKLWDVTAQITGLASPFDPPP